MSPIPVSSIARRFFTIETPGKPNQTHSNLSETWMCSRRASRAFRILDNQNQTALFSEVNVCSVKEVKSLSRVWLFGTPTQPSQSIGFSKQKYWSGLLFPSPEDLPDAGIEPGSPA